MPLRLLRRASIRTNLTALVVLCLLPAAAVSAHLVYQNYKLQQERTYRGAVLLARSVAAALDGQLLSVESGLRVLATSSDLERGDLRSFYARAQDALKFQPVSNYALTDKTGRQVLNTLRPFGAPLTPSGAASRLQEVFATGSAVVTDLFTGTLTGEPTIVVAVPVFRTEGVALTLNATLSTARLGEIVTRESLPDGWVVAVLDGSGTIVARSRDAGRFVGQKAVAPLAARVSSEPEGTFETVTKDGVPVLTAFSRSSVSRWSVAVGAPKSALIAQVNQSVAWLVIGVFVALALGSWLAMRLALDIGASVSGLIAPALALGAGRPIVLPRASMPETAAVGEALMRASDMLAQAQHMAHHDGLTGLCNRVLFEELAKRALASAARDGSSFCLLAIDLDGFKEVNDMHGHAAGDHVLKVAADRITGLVRASDTVARLGGDEFVVLLAGADMTEAAVTADKLVAALSTGCPEIDAMVSASIGVAAYPNSGSTLAMLLERADRALYRAKRLGKNRAVLDRAVAVDSSTG